LRNYISLTVKDFAKNPAEIELRDLTLDVGIISQNITVSSEFMKNI